MLNSLEVGFFLESAWVPALATLDPHVVLGREATALEHQVLFHRRALILRAVAPHAELVTDLNGLS